MELLNYIFPGAKYKIQICHSAHVLKHNVHISTLIYILRKNRMDLCIQAWNAFPPVVHTNHNHRVASEVSEHQQLEQTVPVTAPGEPCLACVQAHTRSWGPFLSLNLSWPMTCFDYVLDMAEMTLCDPPMEDQKRSCSFCFHSPGVLPWGHWTGLTY